MSMTSGVTKLPIFICLNNGKTNNELVALTASPNGGYVAVNNKTGEEIISLQVDDYGNGEVGAWNRKGKGRVWRSQ